MKRFALLTVAIAAIFVSAPAFAGSDCNGAANCNTDISDNFSPSSSSTGVGVGVGVAGGGDADATAFGGTAFGGHASGGDAFSGSTAISGPSVSSADVGNGFGNFSPDAHAHQGQGQLQGQIGINEQEQGIFGSGNSHQGQHQNADADAHQGQGQFGFVKTDVEVEGDTTTIDNDFPVNTAAPVFAGNCSQGVSAQWMQGGGSIATGNPVCDYIAVAGAFIAGGDRDNAFRVLGKAETAADWRFVFSRVRMVITLGLL